MTVHLTTRDGVAVLTIDRQDALNALNFALIAELSRLLDTVPGLGVRALLVTGAGAKAFCAGADLTELEDVSFTERLAEVLQHLAAVPVTTIAAISGSCMGLGMQLAVACDIRVVDSPARFAVPVAKLGLMVDKWTLDRVTRMWGEGAARHMVLTAAVLDGEDAWRLGFAQRRGDLDAALDPVRLDPGQFESAILNLAVNARDAMPEGGVLTLGTARARADAVVARALARGAWDDAAALSSVAVPPDATPDAFYAELDQYRVRDLTAHNETFLGLPAVGRPAPGSPADRPDAIPA